LFSAQLNRLRKNRVFKLSPAPELLRGIRKIVLPVQG